MAMTGNASSTNPIVKKKSMSAPGQVYAS